MAHGPNALCSHMLIFFDKKTEETESYTGLTTATYLYQSKGAQQENTCAGYELVMLITKH